MKAEGPAVVSATNGGGGNNGGDSSDGKEGGGRAAIELERKFVLGEGGIEGLRARLALMGAAHSVTTSYHDVYFDNEAHSLVLADHWLRFRSKLGAAASGTWELKTPMHALGARNRDPHGAHAAYREVAGEAAVLDALRQGALSWLGIQVLPPPGLASAHETPALMPFADFGTMRERFTCSHGGHMVSVDVDFATFGYSVVELEIMVSGEAGVAAAKECIDALAVELQLAAPAMVEGGVTAQPRSKLEMFLSQHKEGRQLLALLIGAGVLQG